IVLVDHERWFDRQAVGLLDSSFRSIIEVTGPDRISFVHGLTTNDVASLEAGDGCYAAMTTAQARMIADLRVYIFPDLLWLDCLGELNETVMEILDRSIISEQVELRNRGAELAILSFQGPRAADELTDRLGKPLPPLKGFQHFDTGIDGLSVEIIRHDQTGETGFDLVVARDDAPALWQKLRSTEPSVTPVGMHALNLLRVEAGIPWFGIDMDQTRLPIEADLEERAISYTKGCYIGQEIIARVKAYGEVGKKLRGLVIEGAAPPPVASKIFKEDQEIGWITSSIYSPALDRPIALAYIRRGHNDPGTPVVVRNAEADPILAEVVTLPFYR
ncbi:MAG: YgfZ/GcvT domain-containing protein, partial [Candidatus Bipolaricaulia bacterium]